MFKSPGSSWPGLPTGRVAWVKPSWVKPVGMADGVWYMAAKKTKQGAPFLDGQLENKRGNTMKKVLIMATAIMAIAFLSGCVSAKAFTKVKSPDGVQTESSAAVWGWGDKASQVGLLRASLLTVL